MMIPSPTRAITVSSVAPPISCNRFVRTVTRAFDSHFDSVLSNRTQCRLAAATHVGTIDHFRMNARPHRVVNVASRQIDGRGTIKVQINHRSVRGDDRRDHLQHVTPRQIMCFKSSSADA